VVGKRGVGEKNASSKSLAARCLCDERVGRLAISANGAPEQHDIRNSEAQLRLSFSNIGRATEKQTVYESPSLGVG
jgi:hypothetical protein